MEKVPCAYCGNIQYIQAFWRLGELFCSTTCRTLYREDEEKQKLEQQRRTVEAARRVL